MATDLLLLRVDEPRRQIVMEGDCDRYRVPSGAITACGPECFYHALDARRSKQLWMVCLMVQFEQGPREVLLSVAATRWRPMTNARRRQAAESLCQRINTLEPPSQRL